MVDYMCEVTNLHYLWDALCKQICIISKSKMREKWYVEPINAYFTVSNINSGVLLFVVLISNDGTNGACSIQYSSYTHFTTIV